RGNADPGSRAWLPRRGGRRRVSPVAPATCVATPLAFLSCLTRPCPAMPRARIIRARRFHAERLHIPPRSAIGPPRCAALCSRAQNSLKPGKNAARLAAGVKNPRFYSLVLLPTGDDLVSLDLPWAIRPYANQ